MDWEISYASTKGNFSFKSMHWLIFLNLQPTAVHLDQYTLIPVTTWWSWFIPSLLEVNQMTLTHTDNVNCCLMNANHHPGCTAESKDSIKWAALTHRLSLRLLSALRVCPTVNMTEQHTHTHYTWIQLHKCTITCCLDCVSLSLEHLFLMGGLHCVCVCVHVHWVTHTHTHRRSI